MSTTMSISDLAQVLFTSPLQASDHPSPDQVRVAIASRLNACQDWMAHVAREAGDHPETYATRMRWALSVVTQIYPA